MKFSSLLIFLPLVSVFISILIPLINKKRIYSDKSYIYIITSVFFLNSIIAFSSAGNLGVVLEYVNDIPLIIISLMCLVLIMFVTGYFETSSDKLKYSLLLMLQLFAFNGIILSRDLFSLFIFIEFIALVSFAVFIIASAKEELTELAPVFLHYIISTLLLMAGTAMVRNVTGTFELNLIREYIISGNAESLIFPSIIVLIGLFIKAGIFPFKSIIKNILNHSPNIMSSFSLSFFLRSGVMIYLIKFLFPVNGISGFSGYLVIIAVLASLAGSYNLKKNNSAYHYLNNIAMTNFSITLMALSIPTNTGIISGLIHFSVSMTGIFLLYLGYGSIIYNTQNDDLTKISGIAKRMPATGRSTIFGHLALSGIPPFPSFWSRLFISIAAIEAGIYIIALATVFTMFLDAVTSIKTVKSKFLGEIRGEFENIQEAPEFVLISIVFAICLLLISAIILLPGIQRAAFSGVFYLTGYSS